MKRHAAWMVCLVVTALAVGQEAQRKSAAKPTRQEQLAAFQDLVGQWRGVGQPRRGSNQGSWIESADWAWKFAESGPSLVLDVERGKYFDAAELRAGDEKKELELIAKTASGDAVVYRGQRGEDGKFVFTSDQPAVGAPARISIRLLAGGKRLVMLLEKPGAGGKGFARLAEVGYTRQGSGFGQGDSGPECIVTGGFGSIEVSYNGQKYFVCCTGCRDYFNENPEEVLAEYKARKAEENKKSSGEESR